MAKSSSSGGASKAPAVAKKSVASKKKAPANSASAAPKKAAPKKAAPKKAATSHEKAAAPATSAVRVKKPAEKAAKAAGSAKASAPAAASGKAAKPSGPAPGTPPAKLPFDAKFLEQQRQALIVERATYTRQAFNLQAEADSLVADFEPGDVQFDEESGEGDTLNIERERDLALSAQARAQVEEIDHALAKFELGTYGICEVSGEPVPEERLEAIPWARQRVQYKTGGIGRR